MNVLAHRIASSTPAVRRRVRVPRELRLLSIALLGTAGLMAVLARVADLVGSGAT